MPTKDLEKSISNLWQGHLSDPKADQLLAEGARALAHPIRIKMLRKLLGKNIYNFKELKDEFPLAQSTISQHLKVLKDTGLIEGWLKGTATYYSLAPQALKQLKVLMAAL